MGCGCGGKKNNTNASKNQTYKKYLQNGKKYKSQGKSSITNINSDKEENDKN
ncbi:hypothetical protein [Neobacillus vireti]|uniref:hypothetical protein n=1 Tax=Neobacillus vireti TaxID=220686 RepID=UPI002FFFE16A